MSSPRIAFQGERGAYSEEATRALFGPSVEAVPCPNFRAVFEAVAAGRVDGGAVPVENSLAGSVLDNVDLLLEFSLPITGELSLRIRHCLMAPEGVALKDIQRVFSHPQALAQCARFLRQHGMTPVVDIDTAGSARKLAEMKPPNSGAIASRTAAELYGLKVLLEGVADSPNNLTRFVSLSAVPPLTGTRSKTSVVFTVENTPGALYQVLGIFAERGVNMTRLEPRPLRRPWDYVFCLDVEGSLDEPRMSEALDLATNVCASVRVLGSYRVAD
ncbi:prephenate dehydratase [Hyalangium versicolor]|uniref:prephenate dehydratase n=1 Tax=Hyalangium versicolor TaxID=2861190 RepID=UPI001CCA038E|nr:prephenate dehydratase [Hyalangium versicolor]